FWNEVREFAVEFDEQVFANAKARARRILTALSAEELAPEGWIAAGRECKFCPFTGACGRKRTDVPARTAVAPDPQFVAEIADLAREAKRHEADGDAALERLRRVQHEIRERLRSRGLSRIVGDGVAVTWSPVKGRQSFDNKAIRETAAAAGIDLTQFETVGDPTD